MNKLLLASFIFALAFVGMASAELFPCDVSGYNMYSFSTPSMNFGGQRFLDSQNIGSSPCCDTPTYNNYQIKERVFSRVISLDTQNYVVNDCCTAPTYNNYQAETKRSPRMIYLDSFHFEKPCCTP